jgi:NADP-dependent aldehyde dehydrogenase
VSVISGTVGATGAAGSDGDTPADATATVTTPVLLATTATATRENPDVLFEECFGPMTLLIGYRDSADLLSTLNQLPGSLTATIHAEPDDDIDDVLATLSDKAGRILFAGWPTGVAVNWAQHHGGPWPATTSLHTSVGATAGRRFQRPIAFQDAPERLLPLELREDNPLGIPRRVDGVLTVAG